MRFLSKAFWQYALFSEAGLKSVFAVYGGVFFVIQVLDHFNVLNRDNYPNYAFLWFLAFSFVVTVVLRRPLKSVQVSIPSLDCTIEVRIADLFDASGAIMVSSNTDFEADVASGKISVSSLQGQLTAKYFTGNQTELISKLDDALKSIPGTAPYPIGTVVPISTHGKTFYFTAMAELNEKGNARSSAKLVREALDGLWKHIRAEGELQEIAVPVVGTGRGRITESRKKMIALIAESFVDSIESGKIADRLVIVVQPDDAEKFSINLYEVKDNLNQLVNP